MEMTNTEQQHDYLLRMNQLNLSELEHERLLTVTRELLTSLVGVYSALAEETQQVSIIKTQREMIDSLHQNITSLSQALASTNARLASLQKPQEAFYQSLVLSMANVAAHKLADAPGHCVADLLSGLSRGINESLLARPGLSLDEDRHLQR
jgi:DNA gyrase/topoisomerase IV subunit A